MFCRLQKDLYLCSVIKNKQIIKHMKPNFYVVVEYCSGQTLAFGFFSLRNARVSVKENQSSSVVKNVFITKVMK